MFRKSSRIDSVRRNKRSDFSYERMEPRQLLAVTSSFDAGTLSIELSEQMDRANLEVINDIVRVNGQIVDGDPLDGLQGLAVESLESINVFVSEGVTDALVQNFGNFISGDLDSITLTGINRFQNFGVLFASDFQADFVGEGGFFRNDFATIQLDGLLSIDSTATGDDDFVISIRDGHTSPVNFENNFTTVEIHTDGSVLLDENGDIELADITAQSLDVSVRGAITQSEGADLLVSGLTELFASTAEFGFNEGTTDLFTLQASIWGAFALNEANSFGWRLDSRMESANVQAANVISMGPSASLNIEGDARFVARRLYLGNGDMDEFNTGRISFEAVNPSEIHEDSSLRIFGRDNNLFQGGVITADGLLTASSDAIFRADSRDFTTRLESTGDIILGNEAEGRIVVRELSFSGDYVRLTLDSRVNLSGDNDASRLRLRLRRAISNSITDSPGTSISVSDNATFIVSNGNNSSGGEVVLGDSPDDFFSAGSVSFSVYRGSFQLTESDRTVITSEVPQFVNSADILILRSAGDLLNAPASSIRVSGGTILSGNNIAFGQASPDDFVVSSSVAATTQGNLTLDLDDSFTISNTVVGGDALIAARGTLRNASVSMLNVGGQASLFGTSLELPGLLTTGSLRFASSGTVDISTDNDLVLVGNVEHRAGDLFLRSAGSITGLPAATLRVADDLRLRADGDIDLNLLEVSSLNFQTSGAVTINALFENPDELERIFIFGSGDNRSFANELRLTTNVDVRDGANAIIAIDEVMEILARNIVLGDTGSDCLSIPADAVFNTTQLAPNVTTDPSCPAS